MFQQIQANKCDEATKAGGFGGAVTEFRSWGDAHWDGIIKKQVMAIFLVNLDDSRFDPPENECHVKLIFHMPCMFSK